jgi:hypothetical protein
VGKKKPSRAPKGNTKNDRAADMISSEKRTRNASRSRSVASTSAYDGGASTTHEDLPEPSDDPVAIAQAFVSDFKKMIYETWATTITAGVILIRTQRKQPLPTQREIDSLIRMASVCVMYHDAELGVVSENLTEENKRLLEELLQSVEFNNILNPSTS